MIESSKPQKQREQRTIFKKQNRISKDSNKRCNVCVIEISEEKKVKKEKKYLQQ